MPNSKFHILINDYKNQKVMKNTHFIDRSKSQHFKSPSLSKQLISKTLHTSNYKNQRYQTTQSPSNNDLDDFFDKFHQTFVVLETKLKQPKSKVKKQVNPNDSLKNKQLIKTYIPKVVKELKISKQLISIAKNERKTTKNTLKLNKTCKSDKNILKNKQNNDRISTKKVSEKKSQPYSKTKPQMRESKRQTIKKHIYGTGSTTATTTLGNSGINLKQDIHIASYLRIKVKAK